MQEELLDTQSCIGRGFDHYITGAFLCSIEYDWSDPDVHEAIRNGDPRYPVTAGSWPRFLFPDPEKDHTDSDEGFAQAPILQKKTNSQHCVANNIGLKSVTARSIAYVAVQLRIAFTQSSWQQVDGDFNHQVFFNNIIDYFEDTPGPIAAAKANAVLEWWTNVFKTGKTRLSQSLPDGGSVKRLATKRDEQERGEHTV
ncbi:hypothetical protein IW261DRAFT_1520079 [Armillaria novae-zelandiae]|uniref:Uncharacterized protein n=1 Tax=Armillaria novae-zelandiae TaxID=153914 RepID=A0AA39NKU3_9AGAR|nr:hypothetical protein IW261DRAFT_1520079 [Armillaria novae-zelandiae]